MKSVFRYDITPVYQADSIIHSFIFKIKIQLYFTLHRLP